MKALVTGSAGFVGRHLVAELRARGWTVDGVDIAAVAPDEYKMDAREFLRSTLATDDSSYDLVLHCAAVVGGRAFIDRKSAWLMTADLALDADLFRWALDSRPGRIVYYSSSAAYPVLEQGESTLDKHGRWPVETLWLSEEEIDLSEPQLPDAGYGWVKLTGERLAREYQAAGGKVTVLRPFSGYGEDQDLSYPFPAIMERVRRGADPIDVWGPGTQVRDWIHIDDVIAGTLAAVEAEVDEPLNLCTGVATSFGSLVAQAVAVALAEPNTANRVSVRWLDGPPEIRTNPDQPTGVLYRVGDPTRMLKVFEPKVTLEEGIRRALA